MKKRFKNLVCVVSVTLILGMVTGCSIKEPNPSETRIDHALENSESPREESTDNTNAQTVPTQTQEPEESQQNNAQNPEAALSADGQEIKDIAEEFAAAYFGGDSDAVQNYLTAPYEWNMDVYAGTGVISEINLKGLTDIGEEEIGNIKVVSLEYRDSNLEETLLHLTLEFIKEEDGWKIQFYGIEG